MTDDLLACVLRCVERIVPGDETLQPTTLLLDLPMVDSVAIVEILEAVEAETGVRLAPELVVPETFVTPAAVAAAFRSSPRTAVGE